MAMQNIQATRPFSGLQDPNDAEIFFQFPEQHTASLQDIVVHPQFLDNMKN
jgi:hypothetical protein